jgi:hypothetical protein
MPETQTPKPQAQSVPLIRLEDVPKLELRNYRLHASNGAPLPLYLRYMGGVWWAIAPLRELPGVKLSGAQSIIVTADSPREAAGALWELLDRLGACIAYPELAAVP